MTADEEYNAITDIAKEQTPSCAYCGRRYDNPGWLQSDHIVSGTAGRALSLLNLNTQNNSCSKCNCERPLSVADKTAAKLATVINEVVRLRSRRFSTADEQKIIAVVKQTLIDSRLG